MYILIHYTESTAIIQKCTCRTKCFTCQHSTEEEGWKVMMKIQYSCHWPEREIMQGPAQEQPPTG